MLTNSIFRGWTWLWIFKKGKSTHNIQQKDSSLQAIAATYMYYVGLNLNIYHIVMLIDWTKSQCVFHVCIFVFCSVVCNIFVHFVHCYWIGFKLFASKGTSFLELQESVYASVWKGCMWLLEVAPLCASAHIQFTNTKYTINKYKYTAGASCAFKWVHKVKSSSVCKIYQFPYFVSNV